MLMRLARLLPCLACALWVAAAFANEQQSWEQWETEIRAYEAADRAGLPPAGAILFVGSSSIRLWEGLAADLPGLQVINRGFGGAQVRDVTFYIDRIVTPYQPHTIVFYAGDNDLAEGRTSGQVTADVMEFVQQARRRLPDVRFVFVSIKPSPSRAHLLPAIRDANARIRTALAALRQTTYVDIHTPMMQDNQFVRAPLFLDDGLHMNEYGYALWREIIGPHLY